MACNCNHFPCRHESDRAAREQEAATRAITTSIDDARSSVYSYTTAFIEQMISAETQRKGARTSMLTLLNRELRRRENLRKNPDWCVNGCAVRVPKRTKITCPRCGRWDHL